MLRIIFTLPAIYASLFVVRLPFDILGTKVEIWWGSIVAGFGMLPGMLLVYGVHLFQQYGFRLMADDIDPRLRTKGPFASLVALLGLTYFFYLIRGIATLIGFNHAFDGIIRALGPYVNWVFHVPEYLLAALK